MSTISSPEEVKSSTGACFAVRFSGRHSGITVMEGESPEFFCALARFFGAARFADFLGAFARTFPRALVRVFARLFAAGRLLERFAAARRVDFFAAFAGRFAFFL